MRRKNIKPRNTRINKACAYFPCHRGLQDCTFCYCPFYPCLNDRLGEYIFSQKINQYIWSCENCVWIHKKMVVENILKSIRAGNINPHQNNLRLKAKNVGIIILGHGSRVKKAKAAISRVIKEVMKNSGLKIIEPAYLQLCSPNLHSSVKKIVKKGCKKIVIAPFFLFTGNHVARDIPKEIGRQAKLYKDVEFVYARNIGCDPRISDIVLECIREAL